MCEHSSFVEVKKIFVRILKVQNRNNNRVQNIYAAHRGVAEVLVKLYEKEDW